MIAQVIERRAGVETMDIIAVVAILLVVAWVMYLWIKPPKR